MAEGDLVFFVRLDLKPEHVAAWTAAVQGVIDAMAQEPAFVSCEMARDEADATRFTLYERWREPTVDDFIRNQMAKPYRREYEANLGEWLRTPRDAAILRHVAVWRRD